MEITKYFIVMFDPEVRQFHDKQEAIDWAKQQMPGNGYESFYVFEPVHAEHATQVYEEVKFVERDPTIGELRVARGADAQEAEAEDIPPAPRARDRERREFRHAEFGTAITGDNRTVQTPAIATTTTTTHQAREGWVIPPLVEPRR